ncbi:hypothetical protein LSTR_LSTR002252 [Laodelphax striatellus]|uniref:Uncharacterized protein n=1 Tax=Laodelphax striatellus TaxID=195883 RepID=A0A482XG86_LAOST|nr:hypothetical protein LSTR_LSTR002252 [Laodelphax striatellus]
MSLNPSHSDGNDARIGESTSNNDHEPTNSNRTQDRSSENSDLRSANAGAGEAIMPENLTSSEGSEELRSPAASGSADTEAPQGNRSRRDSSRDTSPIFFSDDDNSSADDMVDSVRFNRDLDDDDEDDEDDDDDDDDEDDDENYGNESSEQQAGREPREDEAWLRDISVNSPSRLSNSQSSSNSSLNDPDFMKRVPVLEEVSKPKPRHKWFIVPEIMKRELGTGSRLHASDLFQKRCYGSLHVVQRLELMYKLEAHNGCVNALNFNQSGTILASASDDRKVMLWDWTLGKCVLQYESGHTSNVFQAKFLPLSGDRHIVSSARDGQVRMSVLSGTGVCKSTRELFRHKRPVNKLATLNDTPHVFHSAGEDGLVMNIDVREHRPRKFLIVRDEVTGRIPLFSIHNNPMNSHEFCVAGDDKYIRLYDKRRIDRNKAPLKKFCPHHLMSRFISVNVTCAIFNYNGTEILGSYNDDDIYLFDTKYSDGSDYVHRYRGHRNHVTVKGVTFFGPKSQFIVSGSDCGHIYFWEKNTERIVQWMAGDEEGIVNVMEPHPHVPVLATCGLDHDIKIWVPSCEQEPYLDGLKTIVKFNRKLRSDMRETADPWDLQLQGLWRHINRYERNRSRVLVPQDTPPTAAVTSSFDRIFNLRSSLSTVAAMNVDSLENSNSSSSSSSGDDEMVGRPQCSTS